MINLGILYDDKRPTVRFQGIASLEFDVLIEEAHEWSADITTNPVEVGSPVADHILLNPDRFRVTAMVSDSSLTGSFYDNVTRRIVNQSQESQTETTTQLTFNLLRNMFEDRQTLIVYTKYRTYTDMAISSIGIPRSSANGDSIQFSVEFTNIRIVSTQTVKVPPGISKKVDKKSTDAVKKKTDPQKTGGAKQPTGGASTTGSKTDNGSILSNTVPKALEAAKNAAASIANSIKG